MCNIVACFLYCSVTQPDKEGHKGFGCRGKEGDILRAPCFTVQTFGECEGNGFVLFARGACIGINGISDASDVYPH